MDAHQAAEDFDDAPGTDAAGHVDGQALVGELVDYGEALELLAIGAGVEHEVVGPDAVGRAGRKWSRAAGRHASPGTFPRQAEPRLPPEPARTVDTHRARGSAR